MHPSAPNRLQRVLTRVRVAAAAAADWSGATMARAVENAGVALEIAAAVTDAVVAVVGEEAAAGTPARVSPSPA